MREDVEGNVTDHPRVASIAAKVPAAEREVDLGLAPARLADERLHPFTAELVSVAVEEDVVLLLDRRGLEQLGIRGPEHSLCAPRSQLAQPLETALRVRQHDVVLRRIRAVVIVETGVHAAEFRQAHGDVAVVEHDRNAEPLTQAGGDPTQVGHRHGEDDHRGDVAFVLEDAFEMALPARRHIAPDGLACQLVADAVLGMTLGPPQQRISLEPSRQSPGARKELCLAIEGVGLRPPPGRLDGPSAVRGDDQVDADLVEAFPDLPPRRRAPVAEIEVGRRSDGEDLGRCRHRPSMAKAPARRALGHQSPELVLEAEQTVRTVDADAIQRIRAGRPS